MDPEPRSPKPHPRAEQDQDPLLSLSKPAGWAVTAVTAQAELISATVLSLSHPFLSIFFQSRAAPSRFARAASTALRRVALGLISATYAVACLLILTAFAFLLGVFLVRLWVEDPVLLRRPLHLDYTQPQPDAVASIGRSPARGRAIPSGHTVTVSLRLVMPDSGFNRHVGIFQVSTEALSSTGRVLASSSRPCMLTFRSFPVRLMRTFAMSFPLLVGLRAETQQLGFEALRYGEGASKTEAIRVRVMPRAGTMDLPQIYEAEILLRTRLPRGKEVVYNWKWTFYLGVSMNMYVLLLVLLFGCFRPLGIRRNSSSRVNSDGFADSSGRWRRERTEHPWSEIGESSASNVAGDVSISGESTEDDGPPEASES
ncbi:hypothetical protein KSP40_PGU009091 [Platanthera guangdongensis]|uniref:Seipin n=1 Tax=Platanthera guangdongensis TaxID=2320717 RepID=A0ABR2M7Q9_9ASPA